MVKQADEGLVLWDHESIGTLANIVDLVRSNTPVVIFDSLTDELSRLESQVEFDTWSHTFSREVRAAEKRLDRYQRREEKKAKEGQLIISDDRLF